jgi:hypothetical protein
LKNAEELWNIKFPHFLLAISLLTVTGCNPEKKSDDGVCTEAIKQDESGKAPLLGNELKFALIGHFESQSAYENAMKIYQSDEKAKSFQKRLFDYVVQGSLYTSLYTTM